MFYLHAEDMPIKATYTIYFLKLISQRKVKWKEVFCRLISGDMGYMARPSIEDDT